MDLGILTVQKSSLVESGSAFVFSNSLIKVGVLSFLVFSSRIICLNQDAAYNTLLHGDRAKIHWAALSLVHDQLGEAFHNCHLFVYHWRRIFVSGDSGDIVAERISFVRVVEILIRSGKMVCLCSGILSGKSKHLDRKEKTGTSWDRPISLRSKFAFSCFF